MVDHPPSTLAIVEMSAIILGNVAIIAALLVALRHIRTLHVDRTAHLVVEVSQFMHDLDEHIRRLWDRLASRQQIDLKTYNDPATVSFRLVGNFFEMMAALTAKQVFDLQILDAAFGLNQFSRFYLGFANEINILRQDNEERFR